MQYKEKKGFTVVELLVSMAIASIAMLVIVAAYTTQVRSKNTQEALTDMNQATRAAFEIMTDEIRAAGLDPESSGLPMITIATQGELAFSMDRGDGANNAPDGDINDPNERIRYRLSNDANADGVNDNIASGTECNLGRATGVAGVLQPLARNVDVLNFVYLDNAGAMIPYANLLNQAGRNTILSIQVTMVARAGRESEGFFYSYTNNDAYTNLQGTQILAPQGDNFRRLRLATTIYCRNMQ